MGHSQANYRVSGAKRKNLLTLSSQRESVVLALIVEVDLKILIDFRHKGGVFHVDVAFRILCLYSELVN
jgi:hypothetical protein